MKFEVHKKKFSLLAGLHTLSKLFHYKTEKTTYSTTLKTFLLYFKYHLILKELPSKRVDIGR